MAGGGSVGSPGAIDHVDKPFGQIIRIPDHGMSALLYLLQPCRWIQTQRRGNRTSRIADDSVDCAPMRTVPDSWEAWGTSNGSRIGRSTLKARQRPRQPLPLFRVRRQLR